MLTFRRIAVTALVLTIAVGLSGCRSAPDQADPPRPPTAREVAQFEELTVPPEMVPAAPQVDLMNLLAGTEDLPLLIAGTRGEAGRAARLAVWTKPASGPLVDEPVYLETPGPVLSVDLDGGLAQAAVAGHAWTGTDDVSYLYTSTDRATWAAVDLPAELDGVRLTEVTVTGKTTRVFGRDRDRRLVGAQVDDGGAQVLALPDVTDVGGLAAAASSGDTVLVVASIDASPEDLVRSYLSRDGGVTWAEGTIGTPAATGATPEPVEVNDAAVLADGTLVAVGSRAYGAAGERTQASWSSTDGVSWAAEEQAIIMEVVPDGSSWLSSVTAWSDGLMASVVHARSSTSYSVGRFPDGSWRQWAEPDEEIGSPGYHVGLDVQSSAMPESPLERLAAGRGAARLFAPDFSPVVVGELGAFAPWFTPYPSNDRRDDAPVVAYRPFFSENEDGWRSGFDPGQFVLSGDSLVPATVHAPGTGEIASASDTASGTDVLLSSGWNEAGTAVEVSPWTRAGRSEWVPGTGFPAGAYASVSGVARVGDRWIAVGDAAASIEEINRAASAWASTDGLSWTSLALPTAGMPGSDASEVCVLPDGRAVIVGQVVQQGRSSVVTWIEQDGGWSPTIHESADSASADGCLSTHDAVVLSVSIGATSELWSTGDGSTFTTACATGQGEYLGEVVTIPGGFVAAGWMDDDEHVGPVVRVSRDGERWDWVPVPSRDAGGPTLHLDGEDLVVMVNGAGGVQAWKVPDIEAVVRAAAADTGEPSPSMTS